MVHIVLKLVLPWLSGWHFWEKNDLIILFRLLLHPVCIVLNCCFMTQCSNKAGVYWCRRISHIKILWYIVSQSCVAQCVSDIIYIHYSNFVVNPNSKLWTLCTDFEHICIIWFSAILFIFGWDAPWRQVSLYFSTLIRILMQAFTSRMITGDRRCIIRYVYCIYYHICDPI